MARFNRLFFDGLQRLFPTAGVESPYPREIPDVVNWTKDLTSRGFHNNIRLRRSIVIVTGTGADITLSAPEPDQGFFQVPVSFTIWSNAPTAHNCQVQALLTGNPLDPWGAFDTDTRALSQEVLPAGDGAGQFSMTTARVVMPMTRGFQWRTYIFASQITFSFRQHAYWIDVPGDIISIEDFTRQINLR